MTLNKERIKLFVTALRSGQYAQTRHTLHDTIDNSYCCLGVACRVAKLNGLELEEIEERSIHYGTASFNGVTTELPKAVIKWYGFDSDGDLSLVHHSLDDKSYTAMEANDRDGLSFSEIADLVEETYLND